MRQFRKSSYGQRVETGSRVRVKSSSGETMTFTIVHPQHIDPGHGMISCDSPLGNALMEKTKGEIAKYAVENRVLQAEIIEVFSEIENVNTSVSLL